MIEMEQFIEQYYNDSIKSIMPKFISEKECIFAFKVYKAITYTVWTDNMMTKEQKMKCLEGYNKKNVVDMLIKTVETVSKHNVMDEIIMPRDLTSVPSDWIFYNQKIRHNNNGEEFLTIFTNEVVFKTGELAIGFQSGLKDENGEVILDEYSESIYERSKCYAMLSFVKSTNLKTSEVSNHIFLDYYLGNEMFN